MSNDVDNRVCAAAYRVSASTANGNLADGGTEILDFDTKIFDTHAAVTAGASWKFTAPLSGIYRVSAYQQINATTAGGANQAYSLFLYKNGSVSSVLGSFRWEQAASAIAPSPNGSVLVQLNAGDYIDVRGLQNSGGGVNLSTSAEDGQVYVERLSGPSAVAAAEKIYAHYDLGIAQAISNSTATIVNFQSKVVDSHNAVTVGASWIFTAPRSGAYKITGKFQWQAAAWGNDDVIKHDLFVNGSAVRNLARNESSAASTRVNSESGSTLLSLLAGSTIQIKTLQNQGATRTLDEADEDGYPPTWISIESM
jgi:hypothetical protein